MNGQPLLTQGEVELAIAELETALENASGDYAKACDEAAAAESLYRVRRATAELRIKFDRKCSDKTAENEATKMVEGELRARNATAAVERSARVAWQTKLARLNAMQTRSANIRALT